MKYLDNLREWQRLKNDFENSGLTVKDYCDLKGLSKSTFYRNISALREINLNNSIERLPDKISVLINGNKVEFDPAIDDTTLARIIKTCAQFR